MIRPPPNSTRTATLCPFTTLFLPVTGPRAAQREKIPLADLHALVAQDVVSRDDVEKEVRQREAEQVILAGEVQLTTAGLDRHRTRGGLVEGRLVDAGDEIQHRLDAGLQQIGRASCGERVCEYV